MLDSIDEFPIKSIPDVPHWSENYAFNVYFPNESVLIWWMAGRWHSDPTVWRETFALSLPSGEILHGKNFARNDASGGPGTSLTRFHVASPFERVEFSFDGPVWRTDLDRLIQGDREGPTERCAFHIEFSAATPVWDMRGSSREQETMAGRLHFEQIGDCRGTLTVAGQTLDLSHGFAIRDHSRGVRDLADYKRHVWASGRFPESDRAFFVYALQANSSTGPGMLQAAVTKGDRIYPAAIKEVNFIAGPQDIPSQNRMVLDSDLGEMTIVATQAPKTLIGGFVHPFDTLIGTIGNAPYTFLLEQGVRYDLSGEPGLGWQERAVHLSPTLR